MGYIQGISKFLKTRPTSTESIVAEIKRSSAYQAIQQRKLTSVAKLKILLRHAWFTECLINSTGESEYVAYSNHWTPVQLYYSVYLGLRAYFLSINNSPPESHAATLKTIALDIKARPSLYPEPWRVCLEGNPEDGAKTFLNHPAGVIVQESSPLGSSVDFWDRYYLFLKTTRRRQVETKCDQWKKDNKKKRILGSVRVTLAQNLTPTTFFDLLYRLRIRSNYQDADSFLLTLENEVAATEFHDGLSTICWHTLLLIETLISRYIGEAEFEKIVEEFVKDEKKGLASKLIKQRWDIIKK